MSHEFIVTSIKGPLKKFTFKRNDEVSKEISYNIDRYEDITIQALFSFYINDKLINIYSDELLIKVN